MEYLVSRHDENPSSQPLFDFKGWLRATRGVSRSRIIGFDHSFDPPVARYSSTFFSQASTIQTWGDAYMEEVVQRV